VRKLKAKLAPMAKAIDLQRFMGKWCALVRVHARSFKPGVGPQRIRC
jgi:lipocalin